jgi:hypothetical protein
MEQTIVVSLTRLSIYTDVVLPPRHRLSSRSNRTIGSRSPAGQWIRFIPSLSVSRVILQARTRVPSLGNDRRHDDSLPSLLVESDDHGTCQGSGPSCSCAAVFRIQDQVITTLWHKHIVLVTECPSVHHACLVMVLRSLQLGSLEVRVCANERYPQSSCNVSLSSMSWPAS